MSRSHREGRQARPRSGRSRPGIETLEDRTVPASFRTIDGTGNNPFFPTWGSAGVDLLRAAPAAYADGVSAPGGANRPGPRTVSDAVDAQSGDVLNDRAMSAMVYAFGQFIDHDIDLTPSGSAEEFDVHVPKGDPFFDPNGTGTQVISFFRSIFDPATGTSRSNPRQQPNVITAFLDGSMIYGSNATVADALRTHQGGLLKTSPGPDGVIGTGDDLLPYNNQTYFPGVHNDPADPAAAFAIANDAHLVPDDQLFMAGDVRANENIELTSLQTLFVREHNRLAGLIRAANPGMSDEDIYQRARALVGAELQVITYNEWLPAVLGPGALPSYQGYKPGVNPGIATEFSTAAFRLGHSMLGDDVEFLDNNGLEVRDAVPLSGAFFNPPLVAANGIDPLLKYLSSDPAQEVDNKVVDSVRNFLFGPPGSGGLDLASLNIQRGRDHGLADYNTVRAAYGLPRVTSFAQITSDPALQAKLQRLYGNVNNIDLWVGGLAEDHVPGGSVGPLFRRIIVDQFQRLRDGDRFWYQRQFDGAALSWLQSQTLAQVIARNTATTNLQDNVFFFRVSISGTLFNDLNGDGRQERGEPGLAGRTVQLIDPDTGEVLMTETTNSTGFYRFSVRDDGLGLGRFEVRQVLPAGWIQTTADPGVIALTRGGQSADVDLGSVRGAGGAMFATVAPPAAPTGTTTATPPDATQPTAPQPNDSAVGTFAPVDQPTPAMPAGPSSSVAPPPAKSVAVPTLVPVGPTATDPIGLDTMAV